MARKKKQKGILTKWMAARKKRKGRKREKWTLSRFASRSTWAIVLVVILLAGLFYFTDFDPRELSFPEMDLVLDVEDFFPSSSSSSPAVSTSATAPQPQEGKLSIIVLDVGQGNAVFVQAPKGKTMLVDAGEDAYHQDIAEYLEANGITRIDALVGTHPHSDHIGGMRSILKRFEVGSIYMPRAEHNSNTYINLLQEIRDQGKKIQMTKGDKKALLELDPAVTVRVLAPLSSEYASLNNYSIVLKLEYEEFSVLLGGDAEKLSEREMLDAVPGLLPSTVMLLGHHGSSTSNSKKFLDAVSPQAALISCGKDNDYGHPNEDILARVEDMGIPLYRTDERGSIGIYADGQSWEIVTER